MTSRWRALLTAAGAKEDSCDQGTYSSSERSCSSSLDSPRRAQRQQRSPRDPGPARPHPGHSPGRGDWAAERETKLTGSFEESVWGLQCRRRAHGGVDRSALRTGHAAGEQEGCRCQGAHGGRIGVHRRSGDSGDPRAQARPASRIDHEVKVVKAERRYPDDPKTRWALDGLAGEGRHVRGWRRQHNGDPVRHAGGSRFVLGDAASGWQERSTPHVRLAALNARWNADASASPDADGARRRLRAPGPGMRLVASPALPRYVSSSSRMSGSLRGPAGHPHTRTTSAFDAGPLAQLAEQQTLNLRVLGSIPRRLTNLRSRLTTSASYGWQATRRLSAVALAEADLAAHHLPQSQHVTSVRCCGASPL